MESLKEVKWSIILFNVVLIGIGAVLLFLPETSLDIILNIAGIAAIVGGILSVIRYFTYDSKTAFYRNDFLIGLIAIAGGLIVLLQKHLFLSLIPLLLGSVILLSGFGKLQDAVDARRLGYRKGLIYLLLALVNVVVGLLAIFNPFPNNKILLTLAGCGLIYSGLSDLFSALYLSWRLKQFVKQSSPENKDQDIGEDSLKNE